MRPWPDEDVERFRAWIVFRCKLSLNRGVPVRGAERALPSVYPSNLIRVMPAKGERVVGALDVAEAVRPGLQAGVVLSGVTRVLGGKPVLDRIELRVPARGRLGIVGRSGSGKSTLLSLVAGLDEQDAGVVSVSGKSSAKDRLAWCALMPQRDCLLPWRTALDNACLALENRGVPRRQGRRTARTVDGHHRAPPCAVGVLLAFRSRAIWPRLLPAARSARMRSTTSGAIAAGLPRVAG